MVSRPWCGLFPGLLGAVLTTGCCKMFPSFCSQAPQPTWTQTFNGSTTGRIKDLISTPSGYLAVGSDDFGGSAAAAVWTSSDGKTWTRRAPEPAVFPAGSEIRAIHGPNSGGGYVAVGQKSIDHAGVWTTNLSGWALTAANFYKDGTLQGDNTFQLTDVIIPQGTGSAWPAIAVGYVYEPNHNKIQAAIWRSRTVVAGGYSAWDEVYREPLDHNAYHPSQYGGSYMNAVLETTSSISANGGPAFIAVGQYDKLKVLAANVGGYNPDPDASIWTSSDGTSWTHLQTDYRVFASVNVVPPNFDQKLNDVKVCGAAIYVGGYDEGLTSGGAPSPMVPPIWKSVDKGSTWIRLTDGHPEDAAAFNDPSTVYRLDCGGLPFGYFEVAAGTRSVSGYLNGGFWRGANGYPLWHQGGAFGQGVALYATSSGPDILVVAGQDGPHPAIWSYYAATP